MASLWCAYFFRDPERLAPDIPGVLLAPADGVVLPLVKVTPPVELEMGEGPLYRISIFMNVFNVHVNRVPASGRIVKLTYVPGKFINASFDKASEFNERQLVSMECEGGGKVGFVQIAGLVARRIVCHLKEGQEVTAGERFGLIRFGSRVDVYLTGAFEPAVEKGQKTTAGETVLARLRVADAV